MHPKGLGCRSVSWGRAPVCTHLAQARMEHRGRDRPDDSGQADLQSHFPGPVGARMLPRGRAPAKEGAPGPPRAVPSRQGTCFPAPFPPVSSSPSLLAPLPSSGGELRAFALESHMLGPKLGPLVTFIPHLPGCLRIRWRQA